MPELPEVETVCRGLRATVIGKTITGVQVRAPKSSIVVSRAFHPHDFSAVLIGRSITGVERRGKNILMKLSGGATLWVHLKMTGHFFFEQTEVPLDKHDLIRFQLTDHGSPQESLRGGPSTDRPSNLSFLRFNDYRRFGRLRLFSDNELWLQPGLKELGPEPLDITRQAFIKLCRRRPRLLKPALLDQSFLAGIGNIYADESLWAARLHPKRLSTRIPTAQLAELHHHIQRLLRLAIRRNGTSVDTYSNVNGEAGSFQKCLKVYGREGLFCRRCKTTIVRRKLGSRSAHFCPKCQRAR